MPSGSALRRLGLVTVNRIRSIQEKLTEAIQRVAAENMEVARLNGIDAPVLLPDDINVEWAAPLSVAGEEEEQPPNVEFQYRQGG